MSSLKKRPISSAVLLPRRDRFGNVYFVKLKSITKKNFRHRTFHPDYWNLRTLLRDARRKKIKKYFCVYCSSRENLTVDHILPISKGGDSRRYNLQILCQPCNVKKANK